MKSDIRKKVLVILLCMVMVISGTRFGFADGAGETPEDQASSATEKLELSPDAEEPQGAEGEGEDASGEGEPGEAGEGESTEISIEDMQGTETAEDQQPSDEPGTETPDAETPVDGETTEGTELPADDGLTDGEVDENTQGALPEELPEVTKLEYEDDQIKVSVEAETVGIIPQGAALKVVPILAESEETGEQYKEVEAKLLEKAEGEAYDIAGFLAYDISFVNDKDEKLEPNGEVKVSMEYKQAAIPEEVKNAETDAKDMGVTVMHLEEDEQGEVKDVVDLSNVPEEGQEAKDADGNAVGANKIETLDTTEGQEVQKTEFVTESFSAFTITWVVVEGWNLQFGRIRVHLVTEDTDGLKDINEQLPPVDMNTQLWFDDEGNSVLPMSDWIKECNGYAEGFDFEKYMIIENGKQVVIDDLRGHKKGDGTYCLQYEKDGKWVDWVGIVGTGSPYDNSDAVNGDIYFVYKKSQPLEGVETLDSSSMGIKMYMLNYDYTTAGQEGGIHSYLKGSYNKGEITQGLVQENLGSDGWPVTKDGKSLGQWFSKQGANEVNHLFLADKYTEKDRLFYYSCFDNYAYLNGKDFIVYNACGTPTRWDERAIYHRGHFFPYNNIQEGRFSDCQKLYDEKGELPSGERGKLYLAQGKIDFHFSMYMEATFIQAKNGQINGTDMIYEFCGDDDLWVFIDDKLVLDLGGVHDARRGYINFNTGEVYAQGGTSTSLKTIFGKDRFENYSVHTLKMFYMERNDADYGASALKVSFNLPVVEPGTVQVKKELVDTDKDKYGNIDFGFKVYLQNEQGIYAPISWNEKLVDPETKNEISVLLKDSTETPAVDKEDPTIFYLKAEQSAVISGLAEGRSYYVEEVNVDTQKYKDVLINNIGYKNQDTESEWIKGETTTIKTISATVQSRPMVAFGNSCSEKNKNELRITKELAGGKDEVFQVKVWLENQAGDLVACNGDTYYLQDSNNRYYYYNENGELTESTDGSGGSPARVCGIIQDGIIQIPVGYTASITQILAGVEFAVEEVGPLEEIYNAPVLSGVYENKTDLQKTEFANKVTGLGERLQGEIQLDCNAIVTVRNSFKTPNMRYTWELVKKSKTDVTNQKPLMGAKFTLTDSKDSKKVYYGRSNANGVVEWFDVDPDENSDAEKVEVAEGIYTLTETVAPIGYQKSLVTGTVTIQGEEIKIEPSSGDGFIQQEETDVNKEENLTTYKYTFYNEVVYSLPGTGRGGIYWYMISGVLLMMASGLILYIQKSKYAGRCWKI